jgi:hypothetical protein
LSLVSILGEKLAAVPFGAFATKSARSRQRNGFKRAVSRRRVIGRYLFDKSKLGNFGQLNMCDTVRIGTACQSFLGGYRHEVLVELCRTLSYCHPVNYISVRPERCGSVANRNRRRHVASQHHGRSAEASGEATAGGKATTEAGAGGNSCVSPGSANPSNATASARFSTSEACGARENLQQLHRWLPNKLQGRQPTMEWMLLGGWF